MSNENRLELIPEAHREAHSFCFFVHDLMVKVIVQAEATKATHVTISLSDDEKAALLESSQRDEDIVSFLVKNKREDDAQRIVLNSIIIPLYWDTLDFVYEALSALEKRKFTVALALLRKPLKYNLLHLSWLFADGSDYYGRLAKDPAIGFDERHISDKDRKAILSKAIAQLEFKDFFDADVIDGMAFDKTNPKGLAMYLDMANHLITGNRNMRTEDMNLNLIFKRRTDTDIYEGIYFLIGYLLMYLLLLAIEMIGRLASVPKWYRSWALFVTMGPFNAIFNNNVSLLEDLNLTWSEVMECSLCGERYSLGKENALSALATDYIQCPKCGSEQMFPLFWLMSKIDQTAESDGGTDSDSQE